MAKDKSMQLFLLIFVAIVAALAIGLGVVVPLMKGEFKIPQLFSMGEKGSGDFKYSYDGKSVELRLDFKDAYTGAAINPTCYIYDNAQDDWGNGKIDVADGYIDTTTTSTGTSTFQDEPGTYFARCQLSDYYDVFTTVVIPAGGEVPLSEYNDNGEDAVKISMYNVDTLTLSNQDLGIATNESSDITYTVSYAFTLSDNEAFMIDTIKIQEDGTYAFASDTDGDGIYDEGINKLVVKLGTPSGTKSWTPFNVGGSVNEFSGDHVAEWNLRSGDPKKGVFVAEEGTISLTFEVTCDVTLTTTGDADDKCGNGEDFIDSFILVDGKGNAVAFDLLG